GLGFGWPPGEVPVDLGGLLGDGDPAMEQVNPLDPQADELAPAQPGVGRPHPPCPSPGPAAGRPWRRCWARPLRAPGQPARSAPPSGPGPPAPYRRRPAAGTGAAGSRAAPWCWAAGSWSSPASGPPTRRTTPGQHADRSTRPEPGPSPPGPRTEPPPAWW